MKTLKHNAYHLHNAYHVCDVCSADIRFVEQLKLTYFIDSHNYRFINPINYVAAYLVIVFTKCATITKYI